ncbi:MAG: hypothetical protein ABSE93_16360 [Terriglobia bacterium]|jgi:hypothetical protein
MMKMKKGSSARSNDHRIRKKLIYVKSAAEIPDFKSEDEIAAWYETHSTVLIQDQLETLPARVGGKLRARLAARRGNGNTLPRGQHRTRSAQST